MVYYTCIVITPMHPCVFILNFKRTHHKLGKGAHLTAISSQHIKVIEYSSSQS